MRAWQRAVLGALLVGAIAAAGIALNFTLLRLTQDAHDPVGKLSPRAVFSDRSGTATTTVGTATTTVATTTGRDDGSAPGKGQVPRRSDGDSDD